MKGLLLKDVYILNNFKFTFLIQIAVVLIFSISLNGAAVFIVAILPVSALSVLSSTFSYDESASWDRFAATLPLPRASVVNAKYLFSLLITATAAVACFAAGLLSVLVHGGSVLFAAGLALAITALCLACSEPMLALAFKYGAEKTRFASMAFMLAFMAAILLPVYFFKVDIISLLGRIPSPGLFLALLFLLVAALYAACWQLARKVYAKREF